MTIFQIGWGGQGKAWAPSLREAGHSICVVLRDGSNHWKEAAATGCTVLSFSEFLNKIEPKSIVVPLVPDRVIADLYNNYLKETPFTIDVVLACGYPMWSGLLTPNPIHKILMFAPKAIGSELRKSVLDKNNTKKAAILPHSANNATIQLIQAALLFQNENLIEATFAQETVGDLISEQLLLCGGLFTLISHTQRLMTKAGIPDSLIQEEIFTELGFIAKVLQERGLEGTFQAISDSAKTGATVMRDELEQFGLVHVLEKRVQQILSKTFVQQLQNAAPAIAFAGTSAHTTSETATAPKCATPESSLHERPDSHA